MAILSTRPNTAAAVTIHLGDRHIDNIDSVAKIVASTLGKLGCPSCFSGFDLRFNHLHDLVVNPQTLEVDVPQFRG